MITLPNTFRLPGSKGRPQGPAALILQFTTALVFLGLSQLAVAVPAEPEVVTASDNGLFADGSRHWDRIEVAWSPVSNADSYQIWQCTDKDNITTCGSGPVDTVDAPTTRYEHVGPGFCAVKYYAVKACNTDGCSGFSPRSGGSTPSCQDKDWNTIKFVDQTGEWPEPDLLTATVSQGVNNVLVIKFDAKTAQNVRAIAGQFESFPYIGEEAPKRFAISKTRGDLGLNTPENCTKAISTDGALPWEIAGKNGSASDDCELDYNQEDSTYYLNIWHTDGCADPTDTVCRHRIKSRYLDEPGFEVFNISTRAAVDVGDNIAIAGFIVDAPGLTCVAIRAKGPSLSDQLPVFQLLPNPQIVVIDQNTGTVLQMRDENGSYLGELAVNDDWKDGPSWLDLIRADLYRDLDDLDAAMVTCVEPGPYTVLVDDSAGASGIGLVEVWSLRTDYSAPLGNISTRAEVGLGDDRTIGGFVVSGASGTGTRRVMIFGRGPTVFAAQPGSAPKTVVDPRLTVVVPGQAGALAANDNWQDAANSAEMIATGKLSKFMQSTPAEIRVSFSGGAVSNVNLIDGGACYPPNQDNGVISLSGTNGGGSESAILLYDTTVAGVMTNVRVSDSTPGAGYPDGSNIEVIPGDTPTPTTDQAGCAEAVLLLDLAPGAYTAILEGADALDTGIGIVEVNDLGPTP